MKPMQIHHWLVEVAEFVPDLNVLLEAYSGGYTPAEAAAEWMDARRRDETREPRRVQSRRVMPGRGRANPSRERTCFGFADVQIAAVIEALAHGPGHYQYQEALRVARDVAERAHEHRIAAGRRMMREQIDDMDPAEFGAFRRTHGMDED